MARPAAPEGAEWADVAETETPATEQPAVEPCPFCGERHPRSMKCGEWARKIGEQTESPWGTPGFSALPPAPEIQLKERPLRTGPSRTQRLAVQGLVLAFALFGLVELVLLGVGHLDSSSATKASLPACSQDRIKADVNRALAIQASKGALAQRVDQTNALMLRGSDECSDRLLLLYTTYISYQSLCLELPTSDACPNRDSARSLLLQELGSQ